MRGNGRRGRNHSPPKNRYRNSYGRTKPAGYASRAGRYEARWLGSVPGLAVATWLCAAHCAQRGVRGHERGHGLRRAAGLARAGRGVSAVPAPRGGGGVGARSTGTSARRFARSAASRGVVGFAPARTWLVARRASPRRSPPVLYRVVTMQQAMQGAIQKCDTAARAGRTGSTIEDCAGGHAPPDAAPTGPAALTGGRSSSRGFDAIARAVRE